MCKVAKPTATIKIPSAKPNTASPLAVSLYDLLISTPFKGSNTIIELIRKQNKRHTSACRSFAVMRVKPLRTHRARVRKLGNRLVDYHRPKSLPL